MLIKPGPCVFVVETVRPYAERLVDLVFLAEGQASGQPRISEDGLGPVFVPFGQLGGLRLHPPLAGEVMRLYRRQQQPSCHYVRYEFGAEAVTLN